MKPKKMPVKEEKDGEVKKLKSRIRRLEKENTKLKSELRTYDQYFKKTQNFVNDHTKDFSVMELINAAKDNKNLKELKEDKDVSSVCEVCFSKNVQIDQLPFGRITICKDCSHTKINKNG